MTEQPTDQPQGDTPLPKKRGLLRSSAVTGSMTFVSRILGLVRDVVLARAFGPGDGADAFFLAFKIPNFLRRLFAEGAFNQAFVPVLSEYRNQRSRAEIQELIDAVAGYLGTVLLLITVAVVAAAPFVAWPIAYGFTSDPEKFDLFVHMLRINFPYLLLISLTAFCGAILNSYDRFAVPALTPALLNLSLIGSALLLSPYFAQPEVALAWGVLLAGISQLLFQAIPGKNAVDAAPPPDPSTRGREPDRQIDDTRNVWRVSQPDQSSVRHIHSLLAGGRQCLLAVFFRAPDGPAAGHICGGSSDSCVAQPVPPTC